MGRSKFDVNDRPFLYENRVWKIANRYADKRYELEDVYSGDRVIRTREELMGAWKSSNLVFEPDGPNTKKKSGEQQIKSYSFADFQSLPEKYRVEAWWRYCVIYALLKLPRKQRTRKIIKEYVKNYKPELLPEALLKTLDDEVLVEVFKRKIKSAGTLERWINTFVESGYDVRSLVPDYTARGGVQKSKLDDEVEKIIAKVLDECAKAKEKRTRRNIYKLIIEQIKQKNAGRIKQSELPHPSYDTVSQRINKHPRKKAILGRELSRTEEQTDKPVSRGPQADRIMERVEIDHTDLDIILVDDEDRFPIGRPTLTFALDVKSRMPVGFYLGFKEKSYLTVSDCLYHTIMPKPDVQNEYGTKHPWKVYGQPEVLVVDNGFEFIGKDLRDACGQLGIILEQMPVETAWFKGKVERFFRTINDEFLHQLFGNTSSNTVERGDYDSMKYACISLSEFRKIFHIFLLDDYAMDWHEGIEAIPSEVWNKDFDNGYEPLLCRSAEELKILLSRTDEHVIQRVGVEFKTLRYQSDELMRLRSALPEDDRAVKVKFDPSDLGEIHVLDQTGEYEKWITVPAENQDYAKGLSLKMHLLIRSTVLEEKKKVKIEDLAEAKARIFRLAKEAFEKTNKSRTRKKLARLFESMNSMESNPPFSETKKDEKTQQPKKGPSKNPKKKVTSEPGQPPSDDNTAEQKKEKNNPTRKTDDEFDTSTKPQDQDTSENDQWGSSYGLP